MSNKKVSIPTAFKSIIWPRRNLVFIGLLLIIISNAASFVGPISLKYFMDDVIPNKDMGMLKVLVGLVISAILVQAITSFLLTKILSVQAQYLISELRAEVQKKVLSLPIRFFDNAKSGALVSRIMTDVEGVRNLIGTGLVQREPYRDRCPCLYAMDQSVYDLFHFYPLGYFCLYRIKGI